MSRLNDLIRQVARTDDVLAADLQREVAALADRRSFGLNFERHVPEVVELPGRPVRRGDKVRILPPRGEKPTQADERLWRVTGFNASGAEVELAPLDQDTAEAPTTASRDDVVVVAAFRDPIYPGLVSTGKVERGGDKPFHTVINAENYHALQALLFTHHGKIDAIYIDPPYNTGAKDWKYNNHYVEGDDLYRHSKWLAFMERRLLLAKDLLNPDGSVLIVTIDEKEYLRLGLLLEQVFPGCTSHMISAVINPRGAPRSEGFNRVDEYIYVVRFGGQQVDPGAYPLSSLPFEPSATQDAKGASAAKPAKRTPIHWQTLRRRNAASARPNQFYPIFVNQVTKRIDSVGEACPYGDDRPSVECPPGCVAVWPLSDDGVERCWGLIPSGLRSRLEHGHARVTRHHPDKPQPYVVQYLMAGALSDIADGRAEVEGEDEYGGVIAYYVADKEPVAASSTQWNLRSHFAGNYGTRTLASLVPGRNFPFPKSPYAVEDALRLFIGKKPDALVLDFFSGSGTTAHAVMRLNGQDGGRRKSISITNNEVSAAEREDLRARRLRPGDPDWEALGICEHITKPRITAAVTGRTHTDEPVEGEYKFRYPSGMADGLEENVEFFALTYEAPLRVASGRDFDRIAPLLWMRAGARGRRIEDVSKGWAVAETYGVLSDLDLVEPFLRAIRDGSEVVMAFIVTNEDRLFETISRELPEHVEPVRLYESYLRNFEIATGRSTR